LLSSNFRKGQEVLADDIIFQQSENDYIKILQTFKKTQATSQKIYKVSNDINITNKSDTIHIDPSGMIFLIILWHCRMESFTWYCCRIKACRLCPSWNNFCEPAGGCWNNLPISASSSEESLEGLPVFLNSCKASIPCSQAIFTHLSMVVLVSFEKWLKEVGDSPAITKVTISTLCKYLQSADEARMDLPSASNDDLSSSDIPVCIKAPPAGNRKS
jgi:hypothetical protein